MDQIDTKLLKLLSQNAATTATMLARAVHMSVPAVNKRLARLRESGVIRNYTLRLDPEKIAKPVVGFALLVLNQQKNLDKLLAYVNSEPDIVEFHAITGEYDYIAKIYARDIQDFENKLLRLKQQEGVTKSNTIFSLLEYKTLPGPLPD